MNQKRLFVAIAVLVLAALACGGGSTGDGGPTNTPAPRVLFRDDFDSQGDWGELDDETGLIQVDGGEFVFEIYEPGWFIWSNPGEDISNAYIAVTARNTGEAPDPAFGVICNYQDENNFHYLGATPDGYYAIVLYAGSSNVLTSNDNVWEPSDDIDQNADEYRLEAECREDGTLRLSVNGQEIAEVQDDTWTSGDVGLFAKSFDSVPLAVHFDDLEVTEIRD